MSHAKTSALPGSFVDLEALAARWARPTENARSEVRWSSSAQDFADLYNRMMPRMDEILNVFRGVPTSDLDPAQQRLFQLACAFAEAAPHHELYNGSGAVPYSFSAKRFVPAHGDEAL